MRIFGFEISRRSEGVSTDTIIRRLEAAYETASGVVVTPETCMQSPTVRAVIGAISGRISTLPVHVLQKTTSKGRTRKEPQPNHPVARLLRQPNGWQTRANYWQDAVSWLVRYGNFYAFKARGKTGPILRLEPVHPNSVSLEQDDDLAITYTVIGKKAGARFVYDQSEIHHVRGLARDGLTGDSPIMDVREAIALEIAAEKMGASFLGNGAMPSLVFKYAQGSKGHQTDEERKRFIEEFQAAYSKKGRFKSILLPKGIDLDNPIAVENEKAQFLDTRQFQRTVIAGALGVPPHLVGDLTKMTFGNVEQQSLDFVQNVVLPYCNLFESAMERDLLTPEDRHNGIIIRFNLEAALRGDFKSQQEGLNIMRNAGVISPNDWREALNMNPIAPEDGGDDYWRKGPSGQSADPATAVPKEPANDTDEEPSDAAA